MGDHQVDPTSVQKYKNDVALGYEDRWGDERYQSIDERKDEGAFPIEAMRALTIGKYQTMWFEMPMLKGALEMNAYQLLLQREKPATIFELGAWHGTSAAWMADLSKLFGQETHVYSVDIDISMVNEKAKRDNVTFIQGDCMKIEEVFPDEMLQKLPHPWLISEDAHVNIIGVLEHFLRFAQQGDMICVEDCSPDGPATTVFHLRNEKDEYERFGTGKLDVLKTFLKRNSKRVKVDRLYTDLFGYNGGVNWHGYMKVF